MHMTIVTPAAMVMIFTAAVALAVSATATLRLAHMASMHEHAHCSTPATSSPPHLHSKRNYPGDL
jgi:hypothetical protein